MNRIDEIERTTAIYKQGLKSKINAISTSKHVKDLFGKEQRAVSSGHKSDKQHNFMSWSKRK